MIGAKVNKYLRRVECRESRITLLFILCYVRIWPARTMAPPKALAPVRILRSPFHRLLISCGMRCSSNLRESHTLHDYGCLIYLKSIHAKISIYRLCLVFFV